MQSLVVSVVRLSTAATLFGLEQVQTAVDVTMGRRGLSTAIEDLSNTIDLMAESLADNTAEEKKRTLESVTRATKRVVDSSSDAIAVMDPKRVVDATNDVLRKSTDAVSNFISKSSDKADTPRLAVDILSS